MRKKVSKEDFKDENDITFQANPIKKRRRDLIKAGELHGKFASLLMFQLNQLMDIKIMKTTKS